MESLQKIVPTYKILHIVWVLKKLNFWSVCHLLTVFSENQSKQTKMNKNPWVEFSKESYVTANSYSVP